MARPMLKWVFPSCLALSLGLCSLQAQTQKNIVTVDRIDAVPGLHAHSPIALPTTHPGSREALSKNAASPFAGSASSNAAPSMLGRPCASRAICNITGGPWSTTPKTTRFS